MRQKLALLGLVILSLATPTPASAQRTLIAPEHDLRVGLNLGTVAGALQRLSNTRYRGEWERGGQVCASPRLQIDLGEVKTSTGAYQSFIDGRGGASLGLAVTPRGEVSECVDVSLGVRCLAAGMLDNPLDPIRIAGRCEFSILVLSSVFPIKIEIPPPLALPDRFELKLGPDSGGVKTEFGDFGDDGRWLPAAKPKVRTVDFTINSAADLGTTDLSPNEPALWTAAESDRYYIDGSLGELRGSPVATKAEGAAAVSADDPVGDTGLVGISIAASLFGRTSLSSPGSGLFDAALPLRIHGKKRVKGNNLQYDIYLTAARSALSILEGRPVIAMEFAVEQATVVNLTVGKEHLVKEVGAQLVLDAPTIGADGRMRMRVSKFSLNLSTFLGDSCFCFDLPELNKLFDQSLPDLGNVTQTIELALPECIEVGEQKIKAQNAAWSTYRCQDHGGAYKGLIANIDQGKKTRLHLDLSAVAPRISADQGRLIYTIVPKAD